MQDLFQQDGQLFDRNVRYNETVDEITSNVQRVLERDGGQSDEVRSRMIELNHGHLSN